MLATWYLDEIPFVAELEVSVMGRRTIVAGAREYLCWWDRQDKTVTSEDPD